MVKGNLALLTSAEKQYGLQGEPVEITWFTDCEPNIELPDFLENLFIEIVNGSYEESIFLDYKGVKIYWALVPNSDDFQIFSEEWVALTPGLSNGDSRTFCLENLPVVPTESQEKYNKLFPVKTDKNTVYRLRLARLIDLGKITRDSITIQL